MKGKDFKVFLQALDELEKEKGIEKEKLLETVETALLAAYKKNYGDDSNAKVEINRKSGEVKVFTVKMIVDEVDNDKIEISLEDAKTYKKRIKVGDELLIPESCDGFRRTAIQNAKQIVVQRVREAERENVFDYFKEKIGDIINGIIRRIDERGNIYIDFNGTEAVLVVAEQSVADRYRVGARIKVYVVEVIKSTKFPKVVISRKNEGFLKKLFEIEIPEVEEGTIEIKAIAREAGSRSKVAVYSENLDLDTIGACIGQKGVRIKNIVEELNGEKIDIVNWELSKDKFIANALSPAKVERVQILDDDGASRVIVDENQLSLAIGKSGQNARLAAKLTNMKIDIKTKKSLEENEEE